MQRNRSVSGSMTTAQFLSRLFRKDAGVIAVIATQPIKRA